MKRRCLYVLLGLVTACGGDDSGAMSADTDLSADAAPPVSDTQPSDDADVAADNGPDSEWLAARDYCETVAEMYCAYYLRCGRMAVPDVRSCLAVFAEACEANFEPLYARLEDDGKLRLSRAGVTRCETHLETVACARQLGDLDGGCDSMWRGRVAAGGDCGPGLQSLICDQASTCVLGLDFCGSCQTAAEIDGPCDATNRCRATARCIGDKCVARGPPGDPCDDDRPCVIGAGCVSGECVGYEVVGLGQGCDQARRCQYKAACVAGSCVETKLQGELCSDTMPCASGACQADRCVAVEPGPFSCL